MRYVVLALILLPGLLVYAFGVPERVLALLTEAETAVARPPVTILLVEGSNQVAQVGAAIPREQILIGNADVVAIRSERIVTTSIEAASVALNELGWDDRELDIVHPSQLGRPGSRPPDPDEDDGASLGEIAKKRVLTAGEAIRGMNLQAP